MGRKEKKRKLAEEDAANASTSLVAASSDDDDDEANKDLSLEIVQKALLMRVPNRQNDDVLDGPRGITASEAHSEKIKIQKKKKKKKKKKKLESGDQSVNAVIAEEEEAGDQSINAVIAEEEEEAVDANKATEKMEPVEADIVQMSDNVVLRKLLRGPRYFDPPTDSGWGTCYNCGKEGHAAVNCTAAKRKKPCFICGSLEHNVKRCPTARGCVMCQTVGHRAKNCPEKHKSSSKSSTICLKCGNSGHDMFSCKNDYSQDDLKEVQCYVCQRFGHLCCVNTTDAEPREFSCYRCGQTGHTGLACSRFRTETNDAATPSSCYRCGEAGHFARECSSSVKACSSLQTETTDAATPSSCYKCGEEGHFARECSSSVKVGKRKRELPERFQKENDYTGYTSAPHEMDEARKKPLTEERVMTTPQKSKHRGSWMTEYPSEFSPSKSERNNWRSPVTPYTKSTKIHSSSGGSHAPSSKSSKMGKVYDETPNSGGSAKVFHHMFSASRFGNSGSNGLERSYNWW